MSILIVEDDRLLNHGIRYTLQKEGYSACSAFSYEQGLKLFEEGEIELLLIDIQLGEKNGLELCRTIRETSQVPIIFITANDTDQDMIQGFDVGCDDYIPKPFSLEILRRRVEAVLKRSSGILQDILEVGSLRIDYKRKQVIKEGKELKLTATEYRLIEILSKNKGQVLTRDQILEKLWDIEGKFVDENTLSVNVRRLRIKIEDEPKQPRWIITVFGIGYTWGE